MLKSTVLGFLVLGACNLTAGAGAPARNEVGMSSLVRTSSDEIKDAIQLELIKKEVALLELAHVRDQSHKPKHHDIAACCQKCGMFYRFHLAGRSAEEWHELNDAIFKLDLKDHLTPSEQDFFVDLLQKREKLEQINN